MVIGNIRVGTCRCMAEEVGHPSVNKLGALEKKKGRESAGEGKESKMKENEARVSYSNVGG